MLLSQIEDVKQLSRDVFIEKNCISAIVSEALSLVMHVSSSSDTYTPIHLLKNTFFEE
jgi:hypothetical protein